jgi:hypothetical protein
MRADGGKPPYEAVDLGQVSIPAEPEDLAQLTDQWLLLDVGYGNPTYKTGSRMPRGPTAVEARRANWRM